MTYQTIWEVFEAERPKLVPYADRFDGFHAMPASVSKTCLVRFDNNKYSVTASAVGRPVEVHAYADRIVIRQDGRIVAEHQGAFQKLACRPGNAHVYCERTSRKLLGDPRRRPRPNADGLTRVRLYSKAQNSTFRCAAQLHSA